MGLNADTDTSTLNLQIYDGTRNRLPDGRDVLIRILDGNQKQIFVGDKTTSSLAFTDLPFYDNYGDNYTVIVSASGYRQAGFTPVSLSPRLAAQLDLMLVPQDPHFNFSSALWTSIKSRLPFLAKGVTDAAAGERYTALMEERPTSFAALLNITTAMSQIFLPIGTPLDYLKQVLWDDSLAQDRFFAYADSKLIDQVRLATAQGLFAPEVGPGFFHPGASASWKQVQFGEANVQLTFHEEQKAVIDGVACTLVEPDIDYYKDLLAHTLLEVLPNKLTGGLTNPVEVYVLRWIAGRHAGVPEFNPPYTLDT
jgi:hypothetical protein